MGVSSSWAQSHCFETAYVLGGHSFYGHDPSHFDHNQDSTVGRVVLNVVAACDAFAKQRSTADNSSNFACCSIERRQFLLNTIKKTITSSRLYYCSFAFCEQSRDKLETMGRALSFHQAAVAATGPKRRKKFPARRFVLVTTFLDKSAETNHSVHLT